MLASRIPHGRTARRVEWLHLPSPVRRAVEGHLRTTVVDAVSQGGGFTPGFASVLTGADGSRHFVKAASTTAQRAFAAAYREEAAQLSLLPPAVPAPRLLWTDEVDGWFLLATSYVDARAPYRPWRLEELDAASAAVSAMAGSLTPAPAGATGSAVEEWADWPSLWDRIDHPRAAELRALAGRYAAVVAGDTLVHADVRDDNLLVLPDGSVQLCDWNWPVVGAAWLDSLLLLVGPRGDGLDVEQHIAVHPLLGSVPADDVDTFLALVLGFFTTSANLPVPASSPHIRAAQAWQRDVIDDWLAERRGWVR